MELALVFLLGFSLAALVFGGWSLRLKNQVAGKAMELQLLQGQFDQNQKNSEALSERFELLANRIFEEKTHRFQDQSLKNLGLLLEPFKDRLKEFEKKVEDSYSTERSERSSMRGELQQLMQLNLKMSTEAESLTKALRGDTRTQGNWGEMVLESLLERSGLRKGIEYFSQGIEK